MEQRAQSKKGAVIALVVLVAVVVAAWFGYSALSQSASGAGGNAQASGTANASAAAGGANATGHWDNPALSDVTINDGEGYPITLGTLADGKVTVVNVWASWCPYCIDEMQDYQALYEKYGDKVQFVMLDSAENAREVEKAHSYVEENAFTFPVFYDVGRELQEFFSVASYPTTIVIDANGEVLSNKPGRIVASSLDEALASLTR